MLAKAGAQEHGYESVRSWGEKPVLVTRVNEAVGVVLINTGSTEAPRTPETRAYLRQFLSDPRMLDMNPVARWLLLNLIILPRRPKESAHAYSRIWTEQGSPLLVITRNLAARLSERMPGVSVVFGMRYGEPSIESALEELAAKNVTRIVVAPMYPQYSSAANGSALEVVYQWAAKKWNVPAISVLPPFFDDEGFLSAWAAVAKPVLDSFRPDHVLMSYHGLPERHVKKSDPTGQRCLIDAACCDEMGPANRYCYRAQCLYTSRELARRLGLDNNSYTNSFQSRLLRDPWLMPATDEVVPELARKGVKRLAVMCPAFTADCLETLEEIGLRAKSDFLTSGGEAFQLLPCLNSAPEWVEALAAMLQRL